MLEPVGPLPPSVYWRRRCVALASAVLVLGLLGWGIAALAGGSTDDEAAPRPASFVGSGPVPAGANQNQPGANQNQPGANQNQPGANQNQPGANRPGTVPLGAAPGSAPPGVVPGALSGPVPPGAPAPPGAAAPSNAAASTSRSAGTSLSGRLDPRAALVPPDSANGPLLGAHGPFGIPETSVAPTPAPGAAPPPAPGTTPTRMSSTSPAAAPAPGPAPAPPAAESRPPGPCSDAAVRVTARTDKPRYAPGEKPVLTIVITNGGPVPCVRDLDAARQAVAVVRKPGDGLWSSNDCSPLHTDDVRTLAPGQAVTYSVRWSTRTSTPGCRGERDQVPAGAYQLLARLDGTVSEPVPFILG